MNNNLPYNKGNYHVVKLTKLEDKESIESKGLIIEKVKDDIYQISGARFFKPILVKYGETFITQGVPRYYYKIKDGYLIEYRTNI